jgi:hypothetical protein
VPEAGQGTDVAHDQPVARGPLGVERERARHDREALPALLAALAEPHVGVEGAVEALRTRLGLAFYFLPFWAVFLFFYAGSYDYGADVRYSLVSYAPIVVAGALGLATAVERLATEKRRGLAYGVVTAALAWMFLWQAPHVRAVGEEAWAARADVAFARTVAGGLEPDALVLTHNPNMFLMWGVNAAQMHFATDPGFLERVEARHGSRVYVHWGFWCNVDDPALRQMCDTALSHADATLLHESHERNYRYAFYQVRRPE